MSGISFPSSGAKNEQDRGGMFNGKMQPWYDKIETNMGKASCFCGVSLQMIR